MMLKLVFVLVLVNACCAKARSKRSMECSENEILVECAHCGPKSCSELGFRSPCQGASGGCKEQCVCDDGFVKDDKGVCINKKDCPSCGGDPNAVSGCGNYCGNSCSDYHQPNKTCRTGCRYNSCDCREGFVFDDDVGKCVLKEKCTKPPKCPANETWTDCKPTCPPETCESIYSSYACPAVTENNKSCEAGCKCQDGYLRPSLGGKCIKSEDCPPPTPSCPDNEHYVSNTTDCETSCETKDVRYIKKCERSEAYTGCVCNDGYIRNYQGVCVVREDCPNFTCDGVDEVPNNCAAPEACRETCDTRFRNNKICPKICVQACVCKPGTYKHTNGTCVTPDQCSPPVCNDDEVYKQCGSACEASCSNYNNTCLACIALCVEGCFCKDGLIRGPDGLDCIEPEQCPKPDCGENAEFNPCPSTCFTGTCADIWSRYNCTNAPDCCEPKCYCKSGYFRNKAEKCISTQECIDTRGE